MATTGWSVQKYTARQAAWPYTESDFSRMDPRPDSEFYDAARFVTHIDDNAIIVLRQYYDQVLPQTGKILELCTSWVSHFPEALEKKAKLNAEEAKSAGAAADAVLVTGYGMNRAELDANHVLARRVLKDFNQDPTLDFEDRSGSYDAATCVVSIDYLTQPREVLTSVLQALRPGASVHLVVSNRCFPTKVISRWMNIEEEERLQMVSDYLHFSGYEGIEIVTVEDGKGTAWFRSKDPLWVVRGRKPGA